MVLPEPAMSDLEPTLQRLRDHAAEIDRSGDWPRESWQALADAGVLGWFVPRNYGGRQRQPAEIVRGYVALAGACLTTTFVLTQWAGAVKRLVDGDNENLRRELLPALATGGRFATVGISHLTTSRQHESRPALRATRTAAGWRLDGLCPWVTAATAATDLLVGAVLPDGGQALLMVPADRVRLGEPLPLTALSASHTGQVFLDDVEIPADRLVRGPCEKVLTVAGDGPAGGLNTSALALGVAGAAIEHLTEQAASRDDLRPPARALRSEHEQALAALHSLAAGGAGDAGALRAEANGLVLRASQAALSAAKGAGFVAGHPVGRWCREALFFLVWSCPQPVAHANLCELARL